MYHNINTLGSILNVFFVYFYRVYLRGTYVDGDPSFLGPSVAWWLNRLSCKSSAQLSLFNSTCTTLTNFMCCHKTVTLKERFSINFQTLFFKIIKGNITYSVHLNNLFENCNNYPHVLYWLCLH